MQPKNPPVFTLRFVVGLVALRQASARVGAGATDGRTRSGSRTIPSPDATLGDGVVAARPPPPWGRGGGACRAATSRRPRRCGRNGRKDAPWLAKGSVVPHCGTALGDGV